MLSFEQFNFGFVRAYLDYFSRFIFTRFALTKDVVRVDSSSELSAISNHLKQGLQQFLETIHPRNLSLFLGLASRQKPHTFFISCSDSRVVGTLITQTNPGELFQMKNAGQIIFPFESQDFSSKATIEYALKVLAIKNIVVCGHSDCGAVKALISMKNEDVKPLQEESAISCYLKSAYPKGLLFKPEEPLDNIIKNHVKNQCQSLLSFPYIREALEKGELNIEGWFYDIASSKVCEVIRLQASSPEAEAVVCLN